MDKCNGIMGNTDEWGFDSKGIHIKLLASQSTQFSHI